MGCCYSKDSDSEGTETWPRSVTPSDNTIQEYTYTSNSPRSNYSPASPMSPYSMNHQPYLINSQSCNTIVQHTEHTGHSAFPSINRSDNQDSRKDDQGVRHNKQARRVDNRTDDVVVPGMAQGQGSRSNGHHRCESYSLPVPVPEPTYGRRSESSRPIKISRYARLNVNPIKTIGV